jgi:hypothetical protein
MEYWGGNFVAALLMMAVLAGAVPYVLPRLGIKSGWGWLPVGLVVSFAILVACQFIVATIFLCFTYGLRRVVAVMHDDLSGGFALLFEMGTETAAVWFPILLVRIAFNARRQRS